MLFRLHSRSEKLAITEKALRDFITRFRARVPGWEVPKKAKGRVFVDKLFSGGHVIFVCSSWDGSCVRKYAEAYLSNSEDSLQHFLKKYVSEDAIITIYNYEVKEGWIKNFYQIQIISEGIIDSEGLGNCCQLNWTDKSKAEISNIIADLEANHKMEGLNTSLLEYNYLQNNSLYDSLNYAVLKEKANCHSSTYVSGK